MKMHDPRESLETTHLGQREQWVTTVHRFTFNILELLGSGKYGNHHHVIFNLAKHRLEYVQVSSWHISEFNT
jgi:hypothetical protein